MSNDKEATTTPASTSSDGAAPRRRSSDESRQATDGAAQRRRSSDESRQSSDGDRRGGRRKSDLQYIAPRNKVATIAIVCSFVFSGGLMLWAFTMPFRSGAISSGGADNGSVNGTPVGSVKGGEFEAQMSADDYIAYTRVKDAELIEKARRRREPDAVNEFQKRRELSSRWETSTDKNKKQIENLVDSLEEDQEMLKGTLEWQTKKELESVIQDSPTSF